MKKIEDKLDVIEAKVDKIDSRMDKMDIHMAIYNQELKDHIRRTELLEETVKPITSHVNRLQGALKLAASTGIIVGLIKLLKLL